MGYRFVAASVAVLALVAGFALGCVTTPRDAAVAQTPALSHFMCYQTTLATAKTGAATVIDQFGQNDRKLFRADMFCAPAKKKPFFKEMPVPAGADHLTCYHTEGASINTIRSIYNQLEQTRLRGLTPRYFCMPTYKKG